MNKTTKAIGTILACLALTGTCLAAPRGGFHHGSRGHGPAPVHHAAPVRHHRHHHAPPPPAPVVVHHHHVEHHHGTGTIALGAAVIGGVVGALLGN